jgi:hypothetical protein
MIRIDATAMKPQMLSTRHLPSQQQLEAWRTWHAPLFDIAALPGEASHGFAAESCLWLLDGMAIERTCAPPLRAVRTSCHVRRDSTDHWVLAIGLDGATTLKVDGESRSIAKHTPFLLSFEEPFELTRMASRYIILYISRDCSPETASILSSQDIELKGASGNLLLDYLMLVDNALHGGAGQDRRRLSAAIGAMVVACMSPSVSPSAIAATQAGLTLRERVRQAVRSQMHSPTLGPKTLSRMVGVSRS